MKIAIKGHESRGKEIIQILESLGGINCNNLRGGGNLKTYYIDEKIIRYNSAPKNYKVYTLEEFEKEFPFKIGDEVIIIGLPDFPKIITQMVWDCDEILYTFEGLNSTWFGVKALKKFEMKEERNITLTLEKAKEWYKKGGELREIALQAFSEKELNPLPRSWEEFAANYPRMGYYISSDGKPLMCASSGKLSSPHVCPSKKSAEAHLAMIQLEQLRDCWRGDWKPEWNNCEKYVIKWDRDDLIVFTARHLREFLAFPTREMAEEFLDCFRDLIEKAGDLI